MYVVCACVYVCVHVLVSSPQHKNKNIKISGKYGKKKFKDTRKNGTSIFSIKKEKQKGLR